MDDTDADDTPAVAAHRSRPGRRVFVEEGNPEAWMATGAFVDFRSDRDPDIDLVEDLQGRLEADTRSAEPGPERGGTSRRT